MLLFLRVDQRPDAPPGPLTVEIKPGYQKRNGINESSHVRDVEGWALKQEDNSAVNMQE